MDLVLGLGILDSALYVNQLKKQSDTEHPLVVKLLLVIYRLTSLYLIIRQNIYTFVTSDIIYKILVINNILLKIWNEMSRNNLITFNHCRQQKIFLISGKTILDDFWFFRIISYHSESKLRKDTHFIYFVKSSFSFIFQNYESRMKERIYVFS